MAVLDKIGNMDITSKNLGTINPQMHNTQGMGYAPDLTGAAGSGDWVSREVLIPMIYVNFDARLFDSKTIFTELLAPGRSKALNALDPRIREMLGTENGVTIEWEASAGVNKLAEKCCIPIQDIGVQARTLKMSESLGGALGIRCGCGVLKGCGVGNHHWYNKEHIKAKLEEMAKSAMDFLNFELQKLLVAKAVDKVVGNDVTRYGQILEGLAELADGLAAPMGQAYDPNHLPMFIDDFRWVILANPYTIKELQLTPNGQWESRFDKGTFDKLLTMGFKGSINGVPVVEVPTTIVDKTDAWIIVPLDEIAYGIACESFYQTADAVYRPGESGGGQVCVDQTKFAYRMIYGILDLGFIFQNRLKGLKGKALSKTEAAGALPVVNVTPVTP